MENMTCPACGSSNIIQRKEQRKIYIDYFEGETHLDTTFEECLDCETDGEFYSDNDELVKSALTKKKTEAIVKIIDALSQSHNLAAVERALDLPQRTLSKWKSGQAPSAAGATLMKLIAFFPWLIDIANLKYNLNEAEAIFGHAIVEYHKNKINQSPGLGIGNIFIQQNNTFQVYVDSPPPKPMQSHRFDLTISEAPA